MMETAVLTDGIVSYQPDEFGSSVAIGDNGGTIAVGAPEALDSLQGAVYVFVKPKKGWKTTSSFNAALTESDLDICDELGGAVAINGNTIIGAAWNWPDVESIGAVFVFVEPEGGWADMTQTARLTSSDVYPDIEFGGSIAMSGNTIAAGCLYYDEILGGGAYVFVKPEGGWVDATETAHLTDTQPGDGLGHAVSIGVNTVVVAAPAGTSGGAEYIYNEPPGGWESTSKYSTNLPFSVAETADPQFFGLAIGGSIVASVCMQEGQGDVCLFGQSASK